MNKTYMEESLEPWGQRQEASSDRATEEISESAERW